MKGKKTGGRQKGTPNKENPLKGYLRTHSMEYFEPRLVHDEDTETLRSMSQFEIDISMLAPDDRVNAELRLLEFHTPKMKAIDMDMNAHVSIRTIEDKLRALAAGDDSDDDNQDNDD